MHYKDVGDKFEMLFTVLVANITISPAVIDENGYQEVFPGAVGFPASDQCRRFPTISGHQQIVRNLHEPWLEIQS